MPRLLNVIYAHLTRGRSPADIAHIEEQIYGRDEPTQGAQTEQDAAMAMVRGT